MGGTRWRLDSQKESNNKKEKNISKKKVKDTTLITKVKKSKVEKKQDKSLISKRRLKNR